MKRVYFLMIAFAMLFVSCSNELQEEQSTPKTYTVSLGVKGEILDVIQTPLTKSGENNNLYGIQVYSTNTPDDKYSYSPYAYGLFNDINEAIITLLEGYSYKFVCSMLVNGKNIVQYNSNMEYYYPFAYNENGYRRYTLLSNSFLYNTTIEFDGLNFGLCYFQEGDYYYYPNTDRYYGEISNFQPITNNTVKIVMKRTVFGVKFIAEGLTEGKIKIVMSYGTQLEPAKYINYSDIKHEIEDIYTFNQVSEAFNRENYSEDIKTSIYWEKADGTEVPIAVNYTLTFTRKMMHTVRINLAGTSTKGESPISITLEDGTLGTGKDYTIGEAQN